MPHVPIIMPQLGESIAEATIVSFLVQPGDTVEAEVTPVGEIRLTPAQSFDKVAFLERLDKLHARMPLTTTTVEAMRREDRY